MKIKIELIAGECNGLYNIAISNNNKTIPIGKIIEGPNTLIFDIDPGELILNFYGKNNNRDTIVKDSKIIKDKYVDIQKILISGFAFERYHLYYHFFDPYISRDCTHRLLIPNKNELLYWYTGVLENHATNDR